MRLRGTLEQHPRAPTRLPCGKYRCSRGAKWPRSHEALNASKRPLGTRAEISVWICYQIQARKAHVKLTYQTDHAWPIRMKFWGGAVNGAAMGFSWSSLGVRL